MGYAPLASIIITNHNYARYLPAAVESSLVQTYRNVEVVVVDDGSTDESREIIAEFGQHVRRVSKENGGQTSALNAGFAASRGEIVVFLDADDTLLPAAVEQTVDRFREEEVIKVHWPLLEVDSDGTETGRRWPEGELPEGDLRDVAAYVGPGIGTSPPTSGNAWSRAFLETVLPLPEIEGAFQIGSASADDCLSFLAALTGRIGRLKQVCGTYRIHGENDYATAPFEERLQRSARLTEHIIALAREYCCCRGIACDPDAWLCNSWFHRITRAVEEVAFVVPAAGDTIILVDDAQWGAGRTMAGHRLVPFLEHNGEYWGTPVDDATAISELERLRDNGGAFIAFAWPAFWWLDYYVDFIRYLRSNYPCVLENDRVLTFDLRP